MTEDSRALNSGDYDGISFFLELSSAPESNSLDATNSECNEYVFISGYEDVRFITENEIIDFISIIDNNMVVYSIAVGEKHT